jgi:hypothetical protein
MQDRVLGRLLVQVRRRQREYWTARRKLREYIGCDPDCDDWFFAATVLGTPNTEEGQIKLAREFVKKFGDTECDQGVKPPGM